MTDKRTNRVMDALARIEALINSSGLPLYQLRPRVREQLDEARRALLLDDEPDKGPQHEQ